MKFSAAILLLALSANITFAQEGIKWMTWEEAFAANAIQERPIFVDVYTSWCGWCKRMDVTTFKQPEIIKYMNEHYYAVKFDAERKDSIIFNNTLFVNENKDRPRGAHQLAIALLDGKMSYPSYAFIGNPWNKTVAPGYMSAKDFEKVINYFVDGATTGKTFEEFVKDFVSKIKDAQ